MARRQLKTLASVTLGAVIGLAGCSGGSSDSAPGSGVLSLALSDAAVQVARQVCIEFTGAEFKKAGSQNQMIVFDPPAKIDLLAYQGMNVAPLLVEQTLEAGDYQWVRLAATAPQGGNGGAGAGMNDTECVGTGSYIVTDGGAVHGLYIPSSAQSGLKLNRGFTLPVGGSADFVAEFDLMKSVHAPEGLDPDYIMRPTIRLLDRAEVGSIAGEVAANLATQADCMPAVYLFNTGDLPDDNEGDGEMDSVDPIASAMVQMQNGPFLYEIGPVLSEDNPVEVIVNQRASANF